MRNSNAGSQEELETMDQPTRCFIRQDIFQNQLFLRSFQNDVLDHGLTNSGTHPNSVSHLFLEVLQTKNGFYLFK